METLKTQIVENRVLTPVGNRVVLQPLLRKQSDGGILYDMSRMDDRTQWLVINVSRKVWEAGLVKVGDHVIIQAGTEHHHEFTDNVVLTDAGCILAKVAQE
jgi:co-chaperonin GroES (HSP10)